MQVGSAKCVHSTLNKPDQQRALAKLHPRPASRSESCASASQCGTLPRVTSIDVEFAHFLVGGKITTAAAEVCLLGDAGHVLLHEYICPGTFANTATQTTRLAVQASFVPADNTEYRNAKWVGGVGLGFFKCAASPATVQRRVQEMLHGTSSHPCLGSWCSVSSLSSLFQVSILMRTGCLLIGYGLSKDLAALHVHHPAALQKDLMKCSKFQNGKGQARKLQDISQQFLGHTIQAGKHSARCVPALKTQTYMCLWTLCLHQMVPAHAFSVMQRHQARPVSQLHTLRSDTNVVM